MIVFPALLADATTPGASPAALHVRCETTDGKSLILPDDERGRPLVLVVGLTKNAGDATEHFETALVDDVGTRASIVGVAALDQVPGFIRAYVKHAIDKQIGPPIAGKGQFVTTFDGMLRADAPPGKADDPVIFVFRADGSVASVVRSPFSEDVAKRIADTLP